LRWWGVANVRDCLRIRGGGASAGWWRGCRGHPPAASCPGALEANPDIEAVPAMDRRGDVGNDAALYVDAVPEGARVCGRSCHEADEAHCRRSEGAEAFASKGEKSAPEERAIGA
jgi:hypothetical protein